jgi:hypothetical protein
MTTFYAQQLLEDHSKERPFVSFCASFQQPSGSHIGIEQNEGSFFAMNF